MQCHLGDYVEYAQLRETLSRREKDISRRAAAERRDAAEDSWLGAAPGRRVHDPHRSARRAGRRPRPAPAAQPPRGGPADGAHRRRAGAAHVRGRHEPAGGGLHPHHRPQGLRRPRSSAPAGTSSSPCSRRSTRCRTTSASAGPPPRRMPRSPGCGPSSAQHPCHGCNDREVHARWAERYHRTDRHARDLERRVEGRTNSIARRFDKVCEVLTELGYLDLVGRRDDGHGLRSHAHAAVHRVRPPGGPVAPGRVLERARPRGAGGRLRRCRLRVARP